MRSPLLVYVSATQPREGQAGRWVCILGNAMVQADDEDDDLDDESDDEDDVDRPHGTFDEEEEDDEDEDWDDDEDEPETWQVCGLGHIL